MKILPLGRGKRERCARPSIVCLTCLALVGATGVAAGRERQAPAPEIGSGAAATPSATNGTPQSAVPAWQAAAGGHMEFEVASVKRDMADQTAQTVHSNVPLGPMDSFVATGGLLQSANFPLINYIVFAYKPTSTQVISLQSQLPKWAMTNRYDIEAHAPGNPTKDQFRLMMQALLADRFKLAMHYEAKEQSVLALVLEKPGKLGQDIQVHPADAPPCSTAAAPGATVAGGFPQQCGVINAGLPNTEPGRARVGARNIPMSMLTNLLGSQPMLNINRPVIDQTGINGNVDFTFDFSPDLPAATGFTADPNGPTFLEALKDQMGMKLVQQNASVDSIVVDHVEEPSEN